ncbi:DMT family transporter [Leucobacter luti]|uniref:DMT family transporter n=1 Tax=Leucobacter luti TaxID=340320 RepID=UPI003D02F871
MTPADAHVPHPAGLRWGAAAVLGAAILWGTTGTAASLAPGVGPLAMGAAALGIGGILQALIAFPLIARERAALRSGALVVLAGAAAVAIYPLAFYSSMRLAGVAVGTVVSLGSAPIISGLLELWIEGRRPRRSWAAAAALGILSCALLSAATALAGPPGGATAGGAAGGGTASTLVGVGLGLVAGGTYALYSWCVRRLIGRGIGRPAAMGAVFGLGGLALMPVLVATGAPILSGGQPLAVTAYMALIPMFLGYLLFGYGLARVPASTATTLTLAEPAVATVLAVVIVGERLPALGWLGIAGIGISLGILALAPRRAPRRAARQSGPRPPRRAARRAAQRA